MKQLEETYYTSSAFCSEEDIQCAWIIVEDGGYADMDMSFRLCICIRKEQNL